MSLRHLLAMVSCVLAALLVAIGVSLPACAIGFQPISPEELKMTSEPLAPGAAAVILGRQVDRDDNGRISRENVYFRIKILTAEGREQANIEIPYFENDTNIANLKARTISPDGSVVDFSGQVFKKDIVKGKYLKYKARTFTLPNVQVGSIIEYYYTIDLAEDALYDSHWILSQDLFTRYAQFSLKPYDPPQGLPLQVRWTWQALPPGTANPKQGTDHIVRMEARNIPAFQSEDHMPPENELKARVDFVYDLANLESDAAKYWKQTGQNWNTAMEAFVSKRGAMEDAVRQIVSPADPPETKLQKIYARVQQLRNTSFEIQKTEQEVKREKEKEPSNVQELWKRGYGNGTSLTWLFLALARAAGFDAHGVWVSDRGRYFFSSQQMNRSKLNSNVVLVKLDGKDLYCDPGSAFVPFGLLPWTETGVAGLKLDKDGGNWIITTLPESSVSRIERKASLKLSPQGDLEGKLTITYTGLEAARWRVDEHNEDETARKKALEDEAQQYIPVASQVELTNKPEWDVSAPPLVAEFKLRVPGWVSGSGRRVYFPVGLFSGQVKHIFEHANRVHPIYFEFPSQETDDISLELPAGWESASLPPAVDQDAHIIAYRSKEESDHGSLHLSRSLDIGFFILETKYYTALRNFFQQVKSSDEAQIVLQPGTAVAGN